MSEKFVLFASPGWVNLLFLTPFIALFLWRKRLTLSLKSLFAVGVFAVAFGLVEAAVVIYLRALAGLPGGALDAFNDGHLEILSGLSVRLIRIEAMREAATMVMLLAVAILAARKTIDRSAVFFWAFSIWDIFYYVWLYITTGWPPSFKSPDVLFLIPVAWESQVWFPILISLLFMAAVILGRKKID